MTSTLLLLCSLLVPNWTAGTPLYCVQIGGQNPSVDVSSYLAEGRAAGAREDWPTAEQSYLQALKQAPTSAEVLVNLGVVYNRQGKTDDAIGAFTRAAQLKPALFAAHLNLGITYFKLGRFGEAADPLRRVLAIQPEDSQARKLLALSLISLERFQDAVEQLEVLNKKQPGDPPILQALGQSYLRLKLYGRAVRVSEQLVAIVTRSAQNHLSLGEALDNASEPERAIS